MAMSKKESEIQDDKKDEKKVKKIPMREQIRKLSTTAGWFTLQLSAAVIFLFAISWWGYTQVMRQVLGRFEMFQERSFSVGDLTTGLLSKPHALLVDPYRTEEYFRHNEYDSLEWPYIPRRDEWPLADTLWYAIEMEEKETDHPEAWEMMNKKGLDDNVNRIVEYWQDLLFQNEIPFKTIKEEALSDISFGKYNLLVLPATLLLSEAEKQGIKDFVAYGGGVLMCWTPGIRDENGKWSGGDFLSQITGGLVSREVRDSTGGTNMILRGNNPITAGIPPGTHLDFYTYNGYVTLDIIEPRTNNDAFWFSPYWKGEFTKSQSLIAHGRYVEGRFVWLSVIPASVQEHKDNFDVMEKIVLNSLSWASGKPVIGYSYWPDGYSAGGAVLLEARGSGRNLQNLVADMNENGIIPDLIVERDNFPPTFTMDTLEVGDFILSTGNPPQLAGLSMKDQLTWMNFHIDRLEGQVGRRPKGLFPTDWNYDEATTIAAVKSDIEYILGEPNPRFYGPFSRSIKAGAWWNWMRRALLSTCPKNQVSLQEWRELKGVRGQKNLFSALTLDIKRIRYANGIYLGVFNPEQLRTDNIEDMPIKIAAQMDSIGIWRTSTSKLMERYTACQDIRVSSEAVTSKRLRVTLSNEGKRIVHNVVIQVFLSADYEEVNVTGQVVGMTISNVRWLRKRGICQFTIPELEPRDNLAVYLDVSSQIEESQEKPGFLRRIFGLHWFKKLSD